MKLNYAVVGTNDMAAAKGFYDALFDGTGLQSFAPSDRMTYWMGADFAFAAAIPFDTRPATVGNGTMVALQAKDKDQVHRLHEIALANGGTDEGAPGPRGEADENGLVFYAAYFRDRDGNKLNALVRNTFRIWQETATSEYLRKDGKPFDKPGAGQLIFSDLGTINVEASRGFSAYRWIRDELVRLGVPSSEIAYMQDFKKSEAKQRLFGDVRAGKVRFLIGSSDTMGTGVNAQLRLKALHHLDVPWLPSQIEQREGRILRQGNQHDVVDIFAYATEGSMDAQMWQNNERKARFIAAALSGDTSVRRLEDLGEGQANQFAMAKAIASGDQRLMQKAGLEADIARLERLRAAHRDDLFAVRRQIRNAERDIEHDTRRIAEIGKDIERRIPTAGEAFAMTIAGQSFSDRKPAGRALMKEIMTLVHLRQEDEQTIAKIGGFDLVFSGKRFGNDEFQYDVALARTGAETDIDLALTVTPLGAVSRIEHILAGFEDERSHYRFRLDDAKRRLASYQSRQGGEFGFEEELADKRRQLDAIEADLADEVLKEGKKAMEAA